MLKGGEGVIEVDKSSIFNRKMEGLKVFDRKFGLSESKYVILSYAKRFLTKNKKI